MKKVVALLIAVMMMASLSVMAFADTSSDGRVYRQNSQEVASISVDPPATSGQEIRVDDNEDNNDILNQLSNGSDGSEKLANDQRAPYVFNVGVYDTTTQNMANGPYPTVTLRNVSIPGGYSFEYVLYYDGSKWVRGTSTGGITGIMPTPTTLVLTNHLPDTTWNTTNGPVTYPGYKGVPIAVVVSATGTGDTPVTPVSPQTGEMTTAAYLLGAAVMAVACAAFVVKSRKAA